MLKLKVLEGQLEELSSAIKDAGKNLESTEQSSEEQEKVNLFCSGFF